MPIVIALVQPIASAVTEIILGKKFKCNYSSSARVPVESSFHFVLSHL